MLSIEFAKIQGVVLLFGYLASAFVFATFFMRSRARLRQVAIVSNVAFIAYGLMGNLIPVLVLHSLLLPLNFMRLCEMVRARRDMLGALNGELRAEWLEPFARRIDLKAGDRLFAKGDFGRSMFFIASGTLRLAESGISLRAGSLIGEIAIFSDQAKRTQTAVATSPSRLLAVSRDEMLALYGRHPHFCAYLLRVVTSRLLENSGQRDGVSARLTQNNVA